MEIETKITPFDSAADDFFGYSVAISSDGSTIVVGSYYDDENNKLNSGSVYIYTDTNWSSETKITPSDSAEGDHLGHSVAVSSDGSIIIAGAYLDDDKGTDSGSVYVIPLELRPEVSHCNLGWSVKQ